MSRFLEIMAKDHFRALTKVYIRTFPFSYARHDAGPVDFMADMKVYEDVLVTFRDDIWRAAAWGISGYSNLFRILARDGFDEFKTIYFLGRAIERRLLDANQVKMAQVHMISMIALLDEKLKSKGVDKQLLRTAMVELIRLSRFDSELGSTGCYLIYKCSSTAPDHYAPPAVTG